MNIKPGLWFNLLLINHYKRTECCRADHVTVSYLEDLRGSHGEVTFKAKFTPHNKCVKCLYSITTGPYIVPGYHAKLLIQTHLLHIV